MTLNFMRLAGVSMLALSLGGCLSTSDVKSKLSATETPATPPPPTPTKVTPTARSSAAAPATPSKNGAAVDTFKLKGVSTKVEATGSNFNGPDSQVVVNSFSATTASTPRDVTITSTENTGSTTIFGSNTLTLKMGSDAPVTGLVGIFSSSKTLGGPDNGLIAGFGDNVDTGVPADGKVGYIEDLRSKLGSTSLDHAVVGRVGADSMNAGGTAVTSEMVSAYGGRATMDMPTTGQATYKGHFEGGELNVVGNAVTNKGLLGDVAANADFGAGTLKGAVSNLKYGEKSFGPTGSTFVSTGAASYGLDFSSAITGNEFKGTASATGISTPTTGVVAGGFFGPGAAEIAGGLAVTGATSGSGTRLVNGVFGAKKQ